MPPSSTLTQAGVSLTGAPVFVFLKVVAASRRNSSTPLPRRIFARLEWLPPGGHAPHRRLRRGLRPQSARKPAEGIVPMGRDELQISIFPLRIRDGEVDSWLAERSFHPSFP